MVAGINRALDTKPAEPTKAAEAPKPAEKTEAEKAAEQARTDAANTVNRELHATAQSNFKKYNFQKVTRESEGLEPEVKKTLERFNIDGKCEWDNAVVDGDTLVVVTKGTTALPQLFGGSSAAGRFFNKIGGWLPKALGRPDKAIAAKKYAELYNASHEKEPEGFAGEPLGHLLKALKSNHYHTISIFHKDEKGKFHKDPSAVAVVDSYMYLIAEHLKRQGRSQAEIDEYKKEYEKHYGVDKVIPINFNEMGDLAHLIAEGLYEAQGFDMLTLAGKVHRNPNVNTENLNYMEVPAHRIAQTNDGHWKAIGSSKNLDDSYFDTSAKKDEYIKDLVDQPEIDITYVRPVDQAKEPLRDILASCDAWQQIYAGNQLRTKDKKDLALIDKVEAINSHLLFKHNTEQNIAKEVTAKLTKHPDKNKDKASKGMMEKLKGLFGGKKKDEAAPAATAA